MRDSQHDEPRQHDGSSLSLLAAEALARLVARDGRPLGALSVTVLERLTQIFLSPGADAPAALRGELRRHRISDSDLADFYLPQIARTLGTDWEMDRISFASLSMAVARMQAHLREIGAASAGVEEGATTGITVLLVVPKGESHTLGPMTVLGQLRRRGVSVSLKIGPTVEELRKILRDQLFDGAIVSVACRDNLELSRKLVKTLKQATGGKLPVALGGAVLFNEPDKVPVTGADVTTNDLTLALAAFERQGRVTSLELERG